MITFDVITLFPNLFTEHLNNRPFSVALKKELAKVNLHNLRDYALDTYGTVDGKTYGGGVGMILMIEPIFNCLKDIYKKMGENLPCKFSGAMSGAQGEGATSDEAQRCPHIKEKNQQGCEAASIGRGRSESDKRVVLLSPRGETYTQQKAREFSKCSQITFICGRYEGVDARVEENLATDVISIGNYVLSGGEIPALAIMESILRLIPGVLEKEEASKNESFSEDNIEYPQYSKPEDFNGFKVPPVLLSGDHKEIQKWRKEHSLPTSVLPNKQL